MNSSQASTPEAVRELCANLGFSLSEEQCAAISGYLNLLVKWNRVMNLVGRSGWRDVLETLVSDSFHLAPLLQALPLPENPECWDLGAGAGLPGIPLRMLWNSGAYTLVEAREKRALFLRTVLASHRLPGTSVFQGRVEAFMPLRPPAQLIVSRAFMPWRRMLDLVAPYTASQGFCVFLLLEPTPGALPPGWTSFADQPYTVRGDTRYLRVLRKEQASI